MPTAFCCGQAALYVQRAIPQVIYVTKGPPFTTLFEMRILPALEKRSAELPASFSKVNLLHVAVIVILAALLKLAARLHGSALTQRVGPNQVVIYVGGLDGAPEAPQLAAWARSPAVAAVFAENLDMPLGPGRPKNLLNAPIGLCMREEVAFAAPLALALSQAPPFFDRHPASVYGCYGADHGGRALRCATIRHSPGIDEHIENRNLVANIRFFFFFFAAAPSSTAPRICSPLNTLLGVSLPHVLLGLVDEPC